MNPFWRDHPWWLRAVAVAFAAALVMLVQLVFPSAFAAAESVMGDLSWRLGASAEAERRVIIVDIDEASLQKLGPWPWPRETMARLSERLDEAGAAVQAFDMAFDAERPGDAALAAVWARVPVVAGQVFSLDPAVTPHAGVVGGALAAAACPAAAPVSQGYVGNTAALMAVGTAVGHLTPRTEFDGVVRKVPALVCHEGRAYPSLALASLWRAAQGPAAVPGAGAGADWQVQAQRPSLLADLTQPAWALVSPSLPGIWVPLDAQGDMRVPYRSQRSALASVSAERVLSGRVDPGLLRGAIALIGTTAFGMVDVTATPLSAVSSGVEVHAQSLAGLLDHQVPYAPRAALAWQIMAGLIGVALLLALAARRRGAPAKRLPIAGVLLALATYAGAVAVLLLQNLWLPWVAPALFMLLAATALATAEHALTRAQGERLSAHLIAYLPAPVAQRLMLTDPSGSVQVDQRNISVLAADIRNFSAFALHRNPLETAALLHAFYCIAVDVVEQHGGVVENVVGDSVLAVWNAYSDCADHPLRALQAGKELLRATRSLLARPLDSADPPVVQPLALGVGIECGQAVVGSFGPARRRAHTALGEPVGVASRLQHMTQDLSMPLLIGPQLAAQLPKQGTEHLGDYLLEGMTRQYAVYAPADWVDLVPSEQLWSRASTSSRSAAVDEPPFSAPTSAHDPQLDPQQDPHRQHGA